MLKVDISNFRNLRDVHLDDPGRVSMVVGFNEAGKSSLIGAIKYALCGTAFGLKGAETQDLVTYGETAFGVRVQLGQLYVNRTLSSGDSIKSVAERLAVPTDVLPLLFDAELCGDGGSKHMKAFLSVVTGARFSPLEHFKHDQEMMACLNLATKAGKTTPKQMVEYFKSVRALNKDPVLPSPPSCSDTPALEQSALNDAVSVAMTAVTEAQTNLREVAAVITAVTAVQRYVLASAAYEAARRQHPGADTLPNRDALQRVVTARSDVLEVHRDYLAAAGFEDAAVACAQALVALRAAQDAAKDTLARHPSPPALPTPPTFGTPAAEQWFAEECKNGPVTLERVNAALVELGELRATFQASLDSAVEAHGIAVKEAQTAAQNAGAWAQFRKAQAEFGEAKARRDAEWARWDRAEKALCAAEASFIAAAGGSFAEVVTDFSKTLLGGRAVSVDLEHGILLNGKPITSAVSASTRWRVEVAVMAAVAKLMNSPLLLIDAADVLDIENRAVLLTFLRDTIAPHFNHIVITSTCARRLEDETALPFENWSKWALSNGKLFRVLAQKAAP